MRTLIAIVVMVLLSCNTFAADKTIKDKIKELEKEMFKDASPAEIAEYRQRMRYEGRIQKRLASPDCADHTSDIETDVELVEVAYSYEFCSSISRIVDNDYQRGWWLHRESQLLLIKLPCECELHTHSDNLSFNAYNSVKKYVDTGKEIPVAMRNYCDSLTP